MTVNLSSVFDRNCEFDMEIPAKSDFEEFRIDYQKQGCNNGVVYKYYRLKKNSYCYIGNKIQLKKLDRICECREEDWICDYGYVRNENEVCEKSQFLLDNQNKQRVRQCLQDNFYFESSGYRKSPKTKCQGGLNRA